MAEETPGGAVYTTFGLFPNPQLTKVCLSLLILVVWVEPMLFVLDDPIFFRKSALFSAIRPYCWKKSFQH